MKFGDKFSLYLDATFTENSVVGGSTYTSCYGFESWYGFTSDGRSLLSVLWIPMIHLSRTRAGS